MDVKSHCSSHPQLQSPSRKFPQGKAQVEDQSEPLFICTICWRPQHTPSKPKLLGSSARIVCRPCWEAVLDLSICWVCGEYIVRGDEVVSLGWCFWHKVCFGCLICGTKMSVPRLEEKRAQGKSEGRRAELEEIPLCSVCSVELLGESEETVLGRGLNNVSRSDGGLSRERLQRLSELGDKEVETTPEARDLVPQDGTKKSRKGCPRCLQQSRPFANIGTFHAILHSAMDAISGDGSADEHYSGGTNGDSLSEASVDDENPVVYLSIFDPVGEPAFRPSKTKPLPKWMQLLPNNVPRDREQKGKEHDGQGSLKKNVGGHGWYMAIGSSSIGAERGDSGNKTLDSSGTPTPRQSQKVLPTPPIDIPNARPNAHTGSKITFRPHKESDLGVYRGDRRSYTVDSFPMIPPEYPRPKTPFPPQARPSLSQDETIFYFSHSPESSINDPLEMENACCGLALTPGVQTPTSKQAPRQPLTPPLPERYRVLPTESSEYLDRYRPKGAASKHGRYVAKVPEPVLSKCERQRGTEGNVEHMADEKRLKRHGDRKINTKLENEEYGLGPRRNDINQELRTLFCEE